MSNAYNNVLAALAADAELQEKVLAASTPEERAALLTAAGLELPTAEEVEAARLSGVAGGWTSTDCAVGCAMCSMAAAST